jgi:hypothetical protein
MAKRKAARSIGRKRAGKRSSSARRGAKKARTRAGASARKRPAAKKAARKASRTSTRKKTGRTAPARPSARTKGAVRKRAVKPVTAALPLRRAPALDRQRRTIGEDDNVPTPPSSLDLDRSASAIRTGRRELRERYAQHTETSPALTGGDVDADWESAYSVGDEAPGGDNPTPDQDIVDDIGRAVGVEYQDNEELKGADKVARRDKNRWELDPASSDDWDER